MKEQIGIWCRGCGSMDLRTRRVTHLAGGIERRRVCKRCGTALLSFERVTLARVRKRVQVPIPRQSAPAAKP